MTAAMDGENDGQIRLTITITQAGQAGWNGTVELAAGTKVQQSENRDLPIDARREEIMVSDFQLKPVNDGKIDLRDLSMCIGRAMEEIKAQGIPEERRDRLVDIGMISINTVMLSFALELALKSALQKANKKPDPIHDLKKLYDNLNKEDQDRISEEWGKQSFLSKEAKDMGPRRFFSLHRKDFENWRYLESPRMEIRDHDMYSAIMAANAASLRE